MKKTWLNNRGKTFGVLAGVAIAAAYLLVLSPYTTIAGCSQAPAVKMVPQNFTQLAKNCGPAVVNISTVKTLTSGGGRVFEHFFRGPQGRQDPFGRFFDDFFKNQPRREFKQSSLGSGFIMDTDGYIVTNNHVIEGADEIQVKLKDGKEYPAEIIGKDASTDLALIKIKADHDLPVLNLGDSDKLEIGQWVLAIGSPFGLEHTVTAGIISAKGRVIGAGPYDDFIQTDASINPGNSGGPLINMYGEVVGINTAIIAGGDGIGFAIPVNIAKEIFAQLKDNGEVTRGWLGVAIQDLDQDLKDYYGVEKGVLISEVFEDDPADKAGIKINDIILSINGKPVESSRDLTRLIAGLSVGSKAEIKVNRAGKIKKFKVIIGRRDVEKLYASGSGHPGRMESELGIEITDITPEMSKQFNLGDSDGVLVVNVKPDSKGAKTGIVKGDIIKEINHQPVENVSDYNRIVDDVKKGDAIHLYLRRLNKGFMVVKIIK
ncbi:MAG: DegQ family serine endoprotease [Desulfobacteraceae bacterium]|nr:DegQ family serine endoprotease [Desulfobacteraceae bacterium]MBC2755054.1 DegQ family serine endoprotease [Desulfobacteraceae bacterium]